MGGYGVRINRALNYAQEKLPAAVELEEVADIAAFSPYHFHRVFMLVVGETFAGFMRKRRLEWAAMELIKTDRRILDISIDVGYESQESFTRAFRNYFATSPGKFRRDVRSPQEAFLELKSLFEIQLGEFMKPEIVERERVTLIGIQRSYDKPDFSGALSQWQEFWSQSDAVNATDRNCFYGLSVVPTRTRQKNNCQGTFQYLSAYATADDAVTPDSMIKKVMPPQKYAKFTFHGPVSGFQSFIMNVWTHYLPESGLEVLELPEIEVYDERFNIDSHDSEMDYLVPVR